VSLVDNAIFVERIVSDDPVGPKCWVIPEKWILFATQRQPTVQSLTLTVFFWKWHEIDRVQTFEMGFDDQKSLDTWLLRLAKMGSWYISAQKSK
jgi:hypothetical protein